MGIFWNRWRALILGTFSMLAIGVAWQLSVSLGFIDAFFISTPTLVAQEFLVEFQRGDTMRDITSTLYAFVLALGLSVFFGIGLGLLAGWHRDLEAILEPFIWFQYSAPTVAFYPVFIAFLGYGTPTVVAIAFLFAVTPIYANTLAGIKNVDRDLVRVATSFGARGPDVFFRVALPGSIPLMVAGLQLGVGRALTGVVVAELFGGISGLGYSINYYAQFLRTTPMMVSIIIVILLGVLLTQMLSFVESKTDAWRTTSQK